MFSKTMFDKATFNTREEGEGVIGVHLLKAGQTCRYFTITVAEMDAPGLWDLIMAKVQVEWDKPDTLADPCPTCGSLKRLWLRRYQGYSFCGFCGTNLDLTH